MCACACGRNSFNLLVWFSFSVRRMLRGVYMMLPVILILVFAVTLIKKELTNLQVRLCIPIHRVVSVLNYCIFFL